MKKSLENSILDLFLFSHKLKFNEIEKSLCVRSNKLNYHLQNLVKKGILIKENSSYSLTETAEHLIPYLSEKKALIPVLLILIGNSKKAFLYERKKRPFKGMLSLPGGRLVIGESIPNAVKRIMKEKHNSNAKITKINSISLEHVKKSNKIIHSFILILVSAKAPKLELKKVDKNKSRIIKSDYHLIKNSEKEAKLLKEIYSKTD